MDYLFQFILYICLCIHWNSIVHLINSLQFFLTLPLSMTKTTYVIYFTMSPMSYIALSHLCHILHVIYCNMSYKTSMPYYVLTTLLHK
jgi:hypothetical protein